MCVLVAVDLVGKGSEQAISVSVDILESNSEGLYLLIESAVIVEVIVG
jgi:hypothetical protein